MLISFSGLDGSGKTTLIAWLKAALEAEQRRVAVLHLNEQVGVYAYLRILRDALSGPSRRAAPGADADADARDHLHSRLRRLRDAVVWSRTLRLLLIPLDLCIFLLYRLSIERIGGRILIMDRYFYDSLVDVADERRSAWLRLLARLTPTPGVPVFLEVGPEEAFARKGEYSVEYLRRRREAYRTIFSWVPPAVILSGPDLETNQHALRQIVLERLGPR